MVTLFVRARVWVSVVFHRSPVVWLGVLPHVLRCSSNDYTASRI
jgi:hypothetical protein